MRHPWRGGAGGVSVSLGIRLTGVLFGIGSHQMIVCLPHSLASHFSVLRVMPSAPKIGSDFSSIKSSLPLLHQLHGGRLSRFMSFSSSRTFIVVPYRLWKVRRLSQAEITVTRNMVDYKFGGTKTGCTEMAVEAALVPDAADRPDWSINKSAAGAA
jgi:hypothetical protein